MKGKKGYPLGARIKRLMQTDEDVGKIASATPVVVGRAMELFLKKLCEKSAQIALSRHSKTILGSHVKSYVMSDPLMDFIKPTVSKSPDLPDDDLSGSRPKRPRTMDASDESTSTAGLPRGRGRPPLHGRGRGRGRPPLHHHDFNDTNAAPKPQHFAEEYLNPRAQAVLNPAAYSLLAANPSLAHSLGAQGIAHALTNQGLAQSLVQSTQRLGGDRDPQLSQHRLGGDAQLSQHRLGGDAQLSQHRLGGDAQLSQHRLGGDAQLSQHRLGGDAQLSQHRLGADAQLSQHRLGGDAQLSQHRLGGDAQLSQHRLGGDAQLSQQQFGLQLHSSPGFQQRNGGPGAAASSTSLREAVPPAFSSAGAREALLGMLSNASGKDVIPGMFSNASGKETVPAMFSNTSAKDSGPRMFSNPGAKDSGHGMFSNPSTKDSIPGMFSNPSAKDSGHGMFSNTNAKDSGHGMFSNPNAKDSGHGMFSNPSAKDSVPEMFHSGGKDSLPGMFTSGSGKNSLPGMFSNSASGKDALTGALNKNKSRDAGSERERDPGSGTPVVCQPIVQSSCFAGSGKRIMLDLNELPSDHLPASSSSPTKFELQKQVKSEPTKFELQKQVKPEPTKFELQKQVKSEPTKFELQKQIKPEPLRCTSEDGKDVRESERFTFTSRSSPLGFKDEAVKEEEEERMDNPEKVHVALPVLPASILQTYQQQDLDMDDDYDS